MDDAVKEGILENVRQRVVSLVSAPSEVSVYLQNRQVLPGEAIDLLENEITFDRAVHYAFVDEQPGYNWGHACRYLVYDAESGQFLAEVRAHFPPGFPYEAPGSMEYVDTNPTPENGWTVG